MATCNGWTHFYGKGKFLWYQTWSLLRNLSTWVSWILATVLQLIIFFMCKLNFPLFVQRKCCVFLCHAVRGAKKNQYQYYFFTHSASILFPELWTTDWNPGGNSHSFMLQVHIHWQGYVPPFQTPMYLLYELHICTKNSADFDIHNFKSYP
jgi:hypothetical protein